jgi:hypothetical protein
MKEPPSGGFLFIKKIDADDLKIPSAFNLIIELIFKK